ncbi:hypothetical protein GCM10009434_08550 [Brevundimonas olei]
MSVRALDGGSMAGSVRTMAHPCRSATETIVGRGSGKFMASNGAGPWTPDARLARIGMREGFLIGDGGTGCLEGFGGLR